MDFKDADQILRETIQFELRHAYYEREQDIALFCEQVTAERYHEEVIKKKNDRLDAHQLKERLKIYTPITKSIISPIKSLYEKGYNSDNIREEMRHENENQLAEIKEAIGKFHAGRSASKYIEKNFIKWNFSNPNAWLITERHNITKGRRVEKVQTYPFFVRSDQAINYNYGPDGTPEWLIVEMKHREIRRDPDKATIDPEQPIVSDFYFYAAGITVTYSEYVYKQPEEVAKGGTFVENVELVTTNAERPKRKFVVEQFETGSKEFPGGKVGANDDPDGPYYVKVPPYYDAEGLFYDIIDNKANLDVITKKHVYPHRHEFVSECDYQNEEGQCISGYLDGLPGKECPNCKGTGYKQFNSAQDKRVYPYPKHLPEGVPFPDLSKMVFNEETQVEEVKLYDEFIDKGIAKVTIAMFGVTSQSNPNPVMNKTATEVNYEQLNVNNPVLRVMNHSADHVMKIHRLTAQYMGFDEGFYSVQAFSKDLKINDVGGLLDYYNKTEGMDSTIRWGLQCDIMSKVNTDMPQLVQEAKVKKEHDPFPQLTAEQVMLHLEQLENTDRNKIYYLYSEVIWKRIREKNANYLTLRYSAREIMIDAEIEKLRSEIQFKAVQEVPMPFTDTGFEEEETEEIEE